MRADQSNEPASLKSRYGPWAVIAGASEGLGAEFARQLAAAGINCILVARRAPVLETLAADLRKHYGIEAIGAAIDLAGNEGCAISTTGVEAMRPIGALM